MPKSDFVPTRPGSPSSRRLAIAAAFGCMALVMVLGKTWMAARHRSPVRGQVRVDGRPVAFGVVTVVTANGATLTASIQPDGTYALPHVPPGPVRIAVASPEPRTVFQKAPKTGATTAPGGPPGTPRSRSPRASDGGSPDVADGRVSIAMKAEGGPPSAQPPARPEHSQWFRIPGRYADPVRSGLAGRISADGATLDLDLSAAETTK